jgi:hypothetical protein
LVLTSGPEEQIDKKAVYLNESPPENDGTTVHKLDVKGVAVHGF